MLSKKVILFVVIFFSFFSFIPLLKDASAYTCNQSCAANPSGCNAPLTCYSTGGSQLCRNPNCLSQTNCICPTATPTPTPTPNPNWTKLKNASFLSGNDLNNYIPAAVTAYDSDDNTQRYFIIADTDYDPGVAAAKSIQLNGAQPSSKNWQAAVTKTTSMSPLNFLAYVKSRKEFKTISSVDDINANNYNNQILISAGDLTVDDTNKNNFNNRNLVVVVNGNLSFDDATFTPTSASTAFLTTGTITFAATVTEAHAIFVAPTINLGTTTNQGLKIVGNLSALSSLISGRKWTITSKPAVFIVFDQNQYLSLLPLLSIASYNWQQLK